MNSKPLKIMYKLIVFSCLVACNCHGQVKGKMILNKAFYNGSRSDTTLLRSSIWYCGQNTIQEITRIEASGNSAEIIGKEYTRYFLFIEPGLSRYTYFHSFSDTATVICQSTDPKIMSKYGGWDLYSNAKFAFDESARLSDTLLNGVLHNRYRYRKINAEAYFDIVLYTNCKLKNLPFQYMKPFSKLIGCAVIRMETYLNGALSSCSGIEYNSQELTAKESEIFSIWKQKRK